MANSFVFLFKNLLRDSVSDGHEEVNAQKQTVVVGTSPHYGEKAVESTPGGRFCEGLKDRHQVPGGHDDIEDRHTREDSMS